MGEHVAWWEGEARGTPSGVAVVCATYNTRELVARLLWSLYRFVASELRSIVIVDNGSSDGSVELLRAVADGGLCRLISNERNRHHGPALTQGISEVAAMHVGEAQRPWVWILDSDCVVAREDVMPRMLQAANAGGARLLGERYWNPWSAEERVHGFSVLFDPPAAWRPEIGAFEDGGDPIGEFERACRKHGVVAHDFPFTREGYVIHRGRSTLSAVLERGETEHPLFDWARDHHEPHFQGVGGGERSLRGTGRRVRRPRCKPRC